MDTMHIIGKLSRTWRRFRADSRGVSVIIFAMAAVPVFAAVAAAIDFSRGNASRTALQAALDSTGVMMSKEATTLTEDQCKVKAKDYFEKAWASMRGDTGAGHQFDGNTTFDDGYFTCKPINGRWTLKMRATGEIDTAMIKIIGVKKINFATSTTLEWGVNKLRVALALDTTGSMSSPTTTKITALKNAVAGTDGLIDLLKAQEKTTGDVYISVVPFAMRVSTNSSNYTQDQYIDWTDWEAEPFGGTKKPGPTVGPGSSCPWTTSTDHFQCTTGPANGSSTTSTVPSSGTYTGYICPSTSNINNDPWNNRYYNGCYTSVGDALYPNNTVPLIWTQGPSSSASCGTRPNCVCNPTSGSGKTCRQSAWLHPWVPNAHSTWRDSSDATKACFTDRGVKLDFSLPANSRGPITNAGNDQNRVDPTAGDPKTRYPADQPTAACPDKMRALANDWTQMKTYINALTTGGGTNQNVGLVWTWQSLKGGGPLPNAPAKDSNLLYDEYIILLSDGLNTGDRWYCDGTSDCPATGTASVATIDARLAGTCANIKASSTPQQSAPVIYTVQVDTNTPADGESAVMKNCATRPVPSGGKGATFYRLTDATKIPDTFKQIAQEIVQTHITH